MIVSATWKVNNDTLSGSISNLAVKAVRQLASKIYIDAINTSPVYTGSYRASWRMSAGLRDMSTTVGGSPGSPLPPPEMGQAPVIKAGQKIVVSNSIPYAYVIEYGHSNQAPGGVLRLAVASAIRRSGYV